VVILVVGVGPGAVATPINLSTMKDPALMQKLERFDNWLHRTRVAPTVSCAFRCNFFSRDKENRI
jgi:NAD(P)-dependent dehydrogenase (short-subunit alcohol dehydrogenase family)